MAKKKYFGFAKSKIGKSKSNEIIKIRKRGPKVKSAVGPFLSWKSPSSVTHRGAHAARAEAVIETSMALHRCGARPSQWVMRRGVPKRAVQPVPLGSAPQLFELTGYRWGFSLFSLFWSGQQPSWPAEARSSPPPPRRSCPLPPPQAIVGRLGPLRGIESLSTPPLGFNPTAL